MSKGEPLYKNWKIQRAMSIEHCSIPEGSEFWITEKLNGIRATYYKGCMVSRTGRRIDGLDHILRCLEPIIVGDCALDGELILRDFGDMTNNEAFSTAAGIVNSNDAEKPQICFNVFDYIPDFSQPISLLTYKHRRRLMDNLKFAKSDPVRIVPVLYHGTDQSRIQELLEEAIANDEEGIIVNLDTSYLKTRHRGILKVKRFYTMDLPIVDFEIGTGRLDNTLGALIVAYKDSRIGVGTGFTDEERNDIWSRRNDLIGTLCEVKYKAITSDKSTGFESLQFPVFVRLRDDKQEISYD